MVSWLSANCVPVISDVHGHMAGLERVLADIRAHGVARPPVFLGDLFWTGEPGRDPRGVLDYLMAQPDLFAVRGNTDDYLFSGWLEAWHPADAANRREKAVMEAFKKGLSPAERRLIGSWPLAKAFDLGGHAVVAAHASPADVEAGLPVDCRRDQWRARTGSLSARVLVTGHLHRGFTRQVDGVLHVGVGAVGRSPGDYDGVCDYALLDVGPCGPVAVHQRVADGSAPASDRGRAGGRAR